MTKNFFDLSWEERSKLGKKIRKETQKEKNTEEKEQPIK